MHGSSGRNERNVRTDRRTYLKTLGAGALATGTPGLAGCLGAEAENRSGSDSEATRGSLDSESTTEADEAQAGGSDTTESESINCNDLESEFAAYDAAGMPWVYTFEYPKNWDVWMENPFQWNEEMKPEDWDMPQEKLKQIELVKVTFNKIFIPNSGDKSSVMFKAYQSLRPERNDKDLDKPATDATELDGSVGVIQGYNKDLFEEFTELDFNGETVTVLRMQNDTYRQDIYVATLPYDMSSDGRRYYQMEFQVSGEDLGEAFEEGFEQCKDTINGLAEQAVQSIRPNPDSIIESMPAEVE